ncbi:MAG: DUF4446 family protein [Candidatus Pacebacteria bacterium]|nr:DUF4446 family protein [Candidatus Paceibacterota bacterium]
MNISFDSNTISLIILSALVLALTGYVVFLHTKLKKFLADKNAESIGDSIVSLAARAETLEKFRATLEEYLISVEHRLKKSVQAVHTVRFNPFRASGGGGNQSFATAFIDESGDGVVISSLYTRDNVSVFGKPLKGHASEYELSGEEKEAIKMAQEKLKPKK